MPGQNAFETVHMLMLQNNRTDWDGVADNSYIGRNALNTSTDWQKFTGGYIDDAGVSELFSTLTIGYLYILSVGHP